MPLTSEKKEGVHFSQWIQIIFEKACLKEEQRYRGKKRDKKVSKSLQKSVLEASNKVFKKVSKKQFMKASIKALKKYHLVYQVPFTPQLRLEAAEGQLFCMYTKGQYISKQNCRKFSQKTNGRICFWEKLRLNNFFSRSTDL